MKLGKIIQLLFLIWAFLFLGKNVIAHLVNIPIMNGMYLVFVVIRILIMVVKV